MSAVSSREKNMLLIAVVVVLYAAAALSYKKQAANWKAAQRIYATAQKKLAEENALIAAKEEWSAKYEQMRDLMPVFPREKDVDTHWLNVMDSLATRNGFTIARRQTNKEAEVGDVFELPIDCKDWEGTLESLVKFLYDLHREGAMLDVRQLYIRQSNKPGYLKGTFTLYCAYMRDDVAAAGDRQTEGGGQKAEAAGSTNGVATADLEVPAPAAIPGPEETGAGTTNPVPGSAKVSGDQAQ